MTLFWEEGRGAWPPPLWHLMVFIRCGYAGQFGWKYGLASTWTLAMPDRQPAGLLHKQVILGGGPGS